MYGVVYSMETAQLDRLNQQEAGFKLIDVEVELQHVGRVRTAVYIQDPSKLTKTLDPRILPTALYKRCCIVGAIQHNLPKDYIEILRSFKNDNRMHIGPQQVVDFIGSPLKSSVDPE